MKQNKIIKSSLAEVIEKILRCHSYSASIEQLKNTFTSFELDIEELEARVQTIEAEIEILIAEQQV